MLEVIVIYSLIITGIYVGFLEGMIFGWLRIAAANKLDKLVGKKVSRYIQKPIWDCLPCMAGLWTIILTMSFDIGLILAVSGLNMLFDNIIEGNEKAAD